MAESPSHLALSELHARSVTITLRLTEETLFLVERLTAGDEEGAMVSTRTPLDDTQWHRLRALAAEARAQIAQVMQMFGLPHQVRDGRRLLDSHLTETWATLEDTRPPHLDGYGRMDPAVATILDPMMVRIIETINAMRAEALRADVRRAGR